MDRGTIPLAMRSPHFPHVWIDHASSSPEETIERLQGATIAVTNKVRFDERVLAGAPGLRMIAETATGFDNIDVAGCRARGIAVANVPAYASQSVAEHVMLMALALRRNLPGYQKSIARGEWQTAALPSLQPYPVFDLEGAVLGLIGYGDIARRVEALARAFGMEVLIAERRGAAAVRRGRVDFEDVLRRSDLVSLHCPLTPGTANLMNADAFARMKRGALLINTARGGVVDAGALAQALKSGHLGGAGVDVLSQEPPRDGSPLLDPTLPNLIVTPHIAWTSRRALAVLTEEVILNIEAFVRGEKRNRIA